jgi:4-amino-4-deoxy-L-arabinose transferase-like glycosyltransferase
MTAVKKQQLLSKLTLVAILLIAFALRVYNLHNIPSGLFIDEAARGYDAYSISRTGADMFGQQWPLFARGFDDYTPALYIYLTIPFVWLLDLSRFSVRLPSAIIGLLTVTVAYQAIRRPFGQMAAIMGAALLAISPWYVLLSRIGVEWNLLAIGPMLTIVLAYRGLLRPKWLVAAGFVGGISLYGYAPVKAFLPLLLAGFTLFYWRQLLRQWRVALLAALILVALAAPVYSFSLTVQGSIRFQEVASFYNAGGQEAALLFIKNYVAYFSPNFLFITDPSQPNVFFIQRLKNVGLLYWFELPLILLGAYCLFKRGQREQYFWLVWLLIAPLGINLHIHSPKPALWLTATPMLHGLAGAGGALLIETWRHKTSAQSKFTLRRGFAAVALIGLIIAAIFNINTMINDLFTQFPLYSAQVADWGYALDDGVADLTRLQPAFDDAYLDTFGSISGIYYAFYARFPPQQRRQEVAQYGENAWQRVGPARIGNVQTLGGQPGCHLILTHREKRQNIAAPNTLLKTYLLPDGEPTSLQLGAVALPPVNPRPVQAVFEGQILLDSFDVVSAKFGPSLPVKPGQALCLVLNWQSAGNLPADYTVFVHLLGPANPVSGSALWAQHDGWPVDGRHPTTSWQPGEVIQDMHVLFVPTDAPPATYRIKVGLYQAATGRRLPVQLNNGEMSEQVTLTQITVR